MNKFYKIWNLYDYFKKQHVINPLSFSFAVVHVNIALLLCEVTRHLFFSHVDLDYLLPTGSERAWLGSVKEHRISTCWESSSLQQVGHAAPPPANITNTVRDGFGGQKNTEIIRLLVCATIFFAFSWKEIKAPIFSQVCRMPLPL